MNAECSTDELIHVMTSKRLQVIAIIKPEMHYFFFIWISRVSYTAQDLYLGISYRVTCAFIKHLYLIS